MKNGRSVRRQSGWLRALAALCGMGLLLGGCGPRSGLYPENTLGTPVHHVYNGFALLRMDRVDDAQWEFEQALKLDPKCSGAYRGMGWVQGRKGDFSAAFASMSHAKKVAETTEEKASVEVGFMALYTMQKGPGWVQRVEQSFKAASALKEDLPEAYFYLGMAYKQADRYADAQKAFEKVIRINRSLVPESEEELASLREILNPGSVPASAPK